MTRDNKIFPMPSNTTCNKKLKAIAELCGIKARLTYHTARHSAATTVLLSNGVPIETVSRIFPLSSIEVSTDSIESEKVRRLCRFGQNLPLSERIHPENLFPFSSVQWTMTATETND